jgi:hypothetical protein
LSKRRIIRNSIFNENTVTTDFASNTSSTIYTLGAFTLDTNLENRVIEDYSNRLSSFSKEYTLETIGIDKTISQKIYEYDNKLKLNIDYNQITSYARYGSVEDLLKFSIKNVVNKYPYSIYINNSLNSGIINTVTNFSYDSENNISTFRIPTIAIKSVSNIILNSNDFIKNETNPLNNFNLSKEKYIVFDHKDPEKEYPVVGFTGNSKTDSFITLSVKGKLFNLNNTTLSKTYHIKPDSNSFSEFLFDSNDIEKYILSNRTENGFKFKMKVLNQNDGRTFYDRNYVWPTSDGYNIDTNSNLYIEFVNEMVNLGLTYDEYKTDVIYRFYTTESLRQFDITDNQKLRKLIRTYGYGFDNMKRLIDGFATLNNLTYKKENSIPDILVKNMARVLGWNVFDLVVEDDLLSKIFSVNTNDVSESIIPSEINIELWRRILVNTKWFFNSKGTRKSIETMFKLIGIPEEFIQLKEYVYIANKSLTTSERKDSITPSQISETADTINPPTYNTDGYPISPKEDFEYYFQALGNKDSGKEYINRFRENGFNIIDQVDNKKTWVYDESYKERVEENTSYSVNDSRLVINTKEIDLGIDSSRGLEYDIYLYNKSNNLPICSKGVSVNILYVNTITQTNSLNTFEIPDIPTGDIQVILNGLVLEIDEDYTISGVDNNIVEILVNDFNRFNDIVTITYVVDGYTNQVEYSIHKPSISQNGQVLFTLPFEPLGDIQLVLNGYTLTNNIDFYINPTNRQQIILTSNVNILTTDVLSIMYLNELNPTNGFKYSDNIIVSSYYSDKLFYNNFQNKYVFVSDYVIPNVGNLKVVLNGITLDNGSDFIINQSNKKQILFSSNIIIRINDVINVFYIIEDSENNDCIDLNLDMNEVSFFEYTDKIYKNLINTRNRKIITDNKGGTYPKLSKVYDLYYKNNINKKNYNEIYSYIRRFDSHFTRFVDQLLPATTILRKSGLIVSNPIFGNQKYKYIRGINDGSEFNGTSELYSCDLFDISGVTTTKATTSQNLGTISLTVSGDNTTIGPTEFSLNGNPWFNGNTISGSTTYTFQNMFPGNYNISVRDGIGCLTTQQVQVSGDCSLFNIVDVNYTGLTSTGSVGAIEIIASGDTAIQYSIDGGITKVNTNLFTNLKEGIYTPYVKNSIGCEITGNTVSIEPICNINLINFELISCVANGYQNRTGSNLTYVNNKLTYNLKYSFNPDQEFKKYVRDNIIIRETTTNQIILNKWVEFIVDENITNIDLGIQFEYNVPTYAQFAFQVEYPSDPLISCEPFETPLPATVEDLLPAFANLEVIALSASTESCFGSTENLYIGGYIALNANAPQNITVEISVTYTTNLNEDPETSSFFITIPSGQAFGIAIGCATGLYIQGLVDVQSFCIKNITNPNVNLNNFGCAVVPQYYLLYPCDNTQPIKSTTIVPQIPSQRYALLVGEDYYYYGYTNQLPTNDASFYDSNFEILTGQSGCPIV